VDLSGSGYDPVVGFCKYGNEPSGSIKFGEFLDKLNVWPPSEGDSAAWNWV
jgi:hypothetical protein